MVGEYFDPHYPARVEGQQQGQIEGFAAGHQAGYDAGHTDGWNACLEVANREMRKQLDYTRQHVERNEILAKQNSDQHALILQLSDERQAVAAEHARALAELKSHGSRVHALGMDYAFRYQKVMLCMLALRGAVGIIVDGDPQGQEALRLEFVRQYDAQMCEAIRKGTIQRPVDQDEAFAKALPETHRFLLRMLRPSDLSNLSAGSSDPHR